MFLFAQWQDGFSDGNFSFGPTWFGDADSFEVLNETLHLNAPASTSESYLVVPSTGAVAGSWEFYLRLDFNPSSSNKLMVYLCSDSANLKSFNQGYFVMIGNSSDEISLYKKRGLQEIELIDGEDGWTNTSSVELKIKVERDAFGTFELFVDSSSSLSAYQSMGQAADSEFLRSSYFGILCDYTATRSDKFWLDDFVVSTTEYVDMYAPILDSFYVVNLNQVELYFNEPIDCFLAQSEVNFSLDGMNPTSIMCSNNSLILNFPFQFGSSSQELSLEVYDLYNNVLDTSFNFIIEDNYSFGSILFSEIYADESPSFGMPNYEFLELYNASEDSIYLENWQLADSGDTIYLPSFGLAADSFIILCKTSAESSYADFGKAKGVPNFPSLNNAGDALLLFNAYGNIVDSLRYSSAWYRNLDDANGNRKKDGGYSFERRLSADLCSNFYHWYPSVAALGASPGTVNSIDNFSFPLSVPRVDSFFLEMDTTLVIYFSEEIPFIQQNNISVSYSYSSATQYNPVEQAFSLPSSKEMYVLVQDPFLYSTNYEIAFTSLSDCYGNAINDFSFSFYRYEDPSLNDLVINELLFNPLSGGSDFIEIYNRSSKYISLEGFRILEYDPLEPSTILDEVLLKAITIGPQEYLVLTEDSANIYENYIVPQPKNLRECSLPNYDDNEGIICLKTKNGQTIDSLQYESSWHVELLDLKDGVSLERLSPDSPSNEASSWHSAAKVYGYATPTAPNSQSFIGDISSNLVVEPEVFSPNNDGFKDYCLLRYEAEKEGLFANIAIYDVMGREVKLIAQHHSLGRENIWQWNGVNNNLDKADVGIYLVVFEIFDLNGKVQRIKEKVVLAASLN